jgi:VanZ family protein
MLNANMNAPQGRRILARWFLAAVVLMVLFCGMFPFDFTFRFSTAIRDIRDRFDPTIDQLWTAGDGLENVVFFMPVGAALSIIVWDDQRRSRARQAARFGLAVLFAAMLSGTVELSQVWLASRDPSLADMCSNTTGAIVGLVLFGLIGEPFIKLGTFLVLWLTTTNLWQVFLAAALLGYAVALAAPIALVEVGDLHKWRTDEPLLIGNETDGVRHWDGVVSDVWLADHAIDPQQVATLLGGGGPANMLGDSLVLAFDLHGGGPYRDITGHSANLVWTPNYHRGARPGATQPDATDEEGPRCGSAGVRVSRDWYLRTPDNGAAAAISRIAHSGAFTLVIDLTVHDLDHGFGWPHIFSISHDGVTCDLQLLQEHRRLELHVRSSATGHAGSDPEFIFPDFFTRTQPQRIVVSYDHGQLIGATDRNPNAYTVRLSPEACMIWKIYPRPYWEYRMDSNGQVIASAIYRGVTFVLFGLLLGGIVRIFRRSGRDIRALMVLVLTAAVAGMETALHAGAHAPIDLRSPVIAFLAGVLGAALAGSGLQIKPWGSA